MNNYIGLKEFYVYIFTTLCYNKWALIMSNDKSIFVDTGAIEKKALNFFKSFIEDSQIISPFLKEGDKEPCWDGHLYLYSSGIKDKDHLIGRVPVQIKGIEVNRFITKDFKFRLEKVDLKAYLNEPTFFIVCQIKKNSKERKLFFRELLPPFVNKLLRDIKNQESRKTLFHPLTEDLADFENQICLFLDHSKRMVSFARAESLSMKDAVKKGIKEFSFIAPTRISNKLDLFKFLSTHNSYLYAEISNELKISMPLSDGPARLRFRKKDDGEVKVGNRVFYKGFETEVIDGRTIITIPNVMTISLPMDGSDKKPPFANMALGSKYLKDAINYAEFAISLYEVGVLTLNSVNLQLSLNKRSSLDNVRKQLLRWTEIENLLKKLNVTKPLDLTSITKENEYVLNLLIDTILKGEKIKLPNQETSIMLLEISNITLLVWCLVGEDGLSLFGDFFDQTIRLSYKNEKGECITVSPFSYLRRDNYWEIIDNINYDNIVKSAQEFAEINNTCYQISNHDVLAMISASDRLELTDKERSAKLLSEALKLNEWLIKNDPSLDMKPIHLINKIQMIKRQRMLTKTELNVLEELINKTNLDDTLKVAVNLLMDKHQEANTLFDKLSEEKRAGLQQFPIWHFAKNL